MQVAEAMSVTNRRKKEGTKRGPEIGPRALIPSGFVTDS